METDATAPVMVGLADGIAVIGELEGVVEGTNVGAAVMNTSQTNN